MLPRETLTQTWTRRAMRRSPENRYGAGVRRRGRCGPVAQIAEKLLSAKHPVMVTSYAAAISSAGADRGGRAHGGTRVRSWARSISHLRGSPACPE